MAPTLTTHKVATAIASHITTVGAQASLGGVSVSTPVRLDALTSFFLPVIIR